MRVASAGVLSHGMTKGSPSNGLNEGTCVTRVWPGSVHSESSTPEGRSRIGAMPTSVSFSSTSPEPWHRGQVTVFIAGPPRAARMAAPSSERQGESSAEPRRDEAGRMTCPQTHAKRKSSGFPKKFAPVAPQPSKKSHMVLTDDTWLARTLPVLCPHPDPCNHERTRPKGHPMSEPSRGEKWRCPTCDLPADKAHPHTIEECVEALRTCHGVAKKAMSQIRGVSARSSRTSASSKKSTPSSAKRSETWVSKTSFTEAARTHHQDKRDFSSRSKHGRRKRAVFPVGR